MSALADNLLHFRQGQNCRSLSITANAPLLGRPPAILLVRPKYPHNVGGVVRMASCYGLGQVWYTGDRVGLRGEDTRLPREERMRDYANVTLFQYDRPFDLFAGDFTPVAVEVRNNAECLYEFEHPENPVYIFGPEDGSLNQMWLGLCHRFLRIPTNHCLNLATAVGTVLYDRAAKEHRQRQRLPLEDEAGNPLCPKCGAASGDNWSQCRGKCPMPGSPHFKPC